MDDLTQAYAAGLKRNTLGQLVPVHSYDEESGIFFLEDGYMGFGFLAHPLQGADDSLIQRLNVMFSLNYPPDSFIQILLMGSQDIEGSLRGIGELRQSSQHPALSKLLENRLAYLRRGASGRVNMDARAYIRNFWIAFSVKVPFKNKKGLPVQEEMAAAKDLRLSFQQTLKSAGFAPETMDAEGYLRTVGQVLHWKPSANWRGRQPYYDEDEPINAQVSESDDYLTVEKNGIWLGDKLLRILSPVRLPAYMGLQNMRLLIGDPMNGVRGMHGNCYLNLTIHLPETSKERQQAERERQTINYQAFGQMAKFVPLIAKKKESADDFHESLSQGNRIVRIKLSIGLFDGSIEESEASLVAALTYLSELGWTFKEDKYIALPMLVNALPLCADPAAIQLLQRYKRMTSLEAIQFMPILGDWGGTGTPRLPFVSRSGQLMGLDLFDSNTNYNACVVAESGSGKSFLTNDIITAYLSSGARCWVIDVGRSYKKLCEAIEGDFVEFSESSGICITPFQLINNYDEEADMLVGIIISMAAVNDRLTDLQQARLRSTLKVLWDLHGKQLNVDLVAEALKQDEDGRVKDVGEQLFAFTSKGEYGRFFNGSNNVSFQNRLTCLELEELNGRVHLQQVVLLILIYQIQQMMYLGERTQMKLLVIDEGWDLLAKANIAKFIETGYRRFRKYRGAAIVVTQSLNDLYGSPSGVAIAENSANLFLLGQKAETIEGIRRDNRLMIGDGGFEYLKSVKTIAGSYSEIFFKTNNGIGIGRLMVDRYTSLLYSTHPKDLEQISNLTQTGMTTAEAISALTNQ